MLLLTLLGKMIGLAVLLGVSALVYDLVASPEFRVRSVIVDGNHLLGVEEVQAAAAVDDSLIFWLRRTDIEARLRSLAPVAGADILLQLPDQVRLVVHEREPAAIWQVGDTPYLVDREGRILAAQQPDHPLLTVLDTGGQPLRPGSMVSIEALQTAAGLDARLSSALGAAPRTYEYRSDTGINVVQNGLPRLIFGAGDDLDWKVAAAQRILTYLSEQRQQAQLVDLRFRDRPYFK
ncbi:MAG: FtsQ-type POTRA domain-containing protein [Chloroflexi bacterium]|nr:FtsQ-type POTRA domain-containing protein [Chloroflexota bacterium]